MTLKEKILSDNYLEDYENPITDYQADIIVKRADDYAISFAEWTDYLGYVLVDNGWVSFVDDKPKTTQELLEIFKKEKGL